MLNKKQQKECFLQEGGSRKSNLRILISERSNDFKYSTLPAREERCISGTVTSKNSSWYTLEGYKR